MGDHQINNPSVSVIVRAPKENSVHQARWILLPLFGLWIIFSVAGVILG
ncbi:hypothetical protein [Mesorhizobium sp. WSM3862]|nr:hypothetical protein [Mesorhizobium sp. WSM3862]